MYDRLAVACAVREIARDVRVVADSREGSVRHGWSRPDAQVECDIITYTCDYTYIGGTSKF